MKKELIKFIRNLVLLLVLVIILFSPVLCFNLYIDPYAIFKSDISKQRIEPNSHFIKMRYILNHPDKFDSFVFGNSRANNIDVTKIPNGKYFNLYYSLGLPKEHLADIKILLKHHLKIKNLLICIDFSAYRGTDAGRPNDLMRKTYPTNTFDLFKLYLDYIFQIPQQEFLNEFFLQPIIPGYKYLTINGRAINDDVEKTIEANPIKHGADKKFNDPILEYENHVDEAIADLSDISKICQANNISLTIEVNPVYKITYLANQPQLHFEFLKKLSAVIDYYDFGGINKVTSNNYFYYEASHFRPKIGDLMLDFIYRNKTNDTLPGFGFLVTKNNVDKRIETLQNQLK